MDTRAIDVLDFWFGPPDDPGHAQPRAAWFKKDEAFDAGIRERFGTLIEQAKDLESITSVLSRVANGGRDEPGQPLRPWGLRRTL